jgi:WhiB family redox-sensing transcriptional regulator
VATTIQEGDLAWVDRAMCSGLTELFFGELKEKPHIRKAREQKAIAICKTCPVMYQCRQFARENKELGVWGGETEDERYFGGFLNDPDVSRRNKQREKRARIAAASLMVE